MDEVSLSKIHPMLYIGNIKAAGKNHWAHILCTAGCAQTPNLTVTNCAFLDTVDTNLQKVWEAEYHIRNGALLLDNILRNIQKDSQKAPILVHCHAGINRSASVIIAYAILNGWTAENAINYVRSQNAVRFNLDSKHHVTAVTNVVFERVLRSMSWNIR